MKKRKLLLLFVAILSLAILTASCENADDPENMASENGYADAKESIAEVKNDKNDGEHEMNKYFDLSTEVVKNYTSITRIDGTITDLDDDHNLAVVEKKDLDNQNNVIKTVSVINIMTGETLRTDTVTNPYDAPMGEQTKLEVTVEYPVIRVHYTYSYAGEQNESSHQVSYYLATNNGRHLHSAYDEYYQVRRYDNGLYSVVMDDHICWIDKSLNVVRTSSMVISGDYDFESFDGEYMGYLYSLKEHEVLIFNRSGAVSGRYTAQENETLKSFILDNGNVLIQKYTEVGMYDKCDFVISGTRYKLESRIMNLVDGAITEVELDFAVEYIETEYYQGNNENLYTLKLAKGKENLVWAYKISGENISPKFSLCVMDNQLNIVYTVKNDTLGAYMNPMYIGNGVYFAPVLSEGQEYYAIFDLDGNFISKLDTENLKGATEKYLVTENAVYDYKMNVVFDLTQSSFSYLGIANNNVYLSRYNFVTGVEETYVIKSASTEPELLHDGIKSVGYDAFGGLIVIYDIEKDVYRVYNDAGDELLVTHEGITGKEVCDDVILIGSTFNGEPIVYIVK